MFRSNTKTLQIPNETRFEPIAPRGIISYVARISPSDAQYLLNLNQKNRKMNKETVRRYRNDMVDQSWQDSASQIQISENGNLLNGQHRLRAMIDSNTSQILTITEGVPESSFAVMDVGRGRSPADALSAENKSYYVVAAASIKLWKVWREGFYRTDLTKDRHKANSVQNNSFKKMSKAATIQFTLDYANATPNMDSICRVAGLTSKLFKGYTSATIGAFLIQANELGHATYEEAKLFCEKIQTGAGLEEKHPVLIMRNRIHTWMQKGEYKGYAVGNKLSILIYIWNCYITGKTVPRAFQMTEGKIEDMKPVKEYSGVNKW